MKSRMTRLLVGLAMLMAAVPTFAHHSFSAGYDIDHPITLKGTLTNVEWVNPHGFIYIDVKNDDGTVDHWQIETGAPSSLLRRGLRKSDFPVGIEVIVKGYRARNGLHVANGRSITLPDGRKLYPGGQADDGPQDSNPSDSPQK
jgi:hypothetical protein